MGVLRKRRTKKKWEEHRKWAGEGHLVRLLNLKSHLAPVFEKEPVSLFAIFYPPTNVLVNPLRFRFQPICSNFLPMRKMFLEALKISYLQGLWEGLQIYYTTEIVVGFFSLLILDSFFHLQKLIYYKVLS